MIWFQLKCLEVVFIKIKVKGYLKNITDNDIIKFETKGIKNRNKIIYSDADVKTSIKVDGDSLTFMREGNDFINTFIFNMKNSKCNYYLKENNYDVDIEINTTDIYISDNLINIKYLIVDSNCEYEYKLEMSDYNEYKK